VVKATIEVYIGKESNKVEDADVGLIHDLREVSAVYADRNRGLWQQLVRPILQDIPARWLAERTGLSTRTIQRLRNGHSRPRLEHKKALTHSLPNSLESIWKHWRLLRRMVTSPRFLHTSIQSETAPRDP